ncbi:MAG: hypothetical protein ACYC2K_13590 [Gemmatimonadales bacterium]
MTERRFNEEEVAAIFERATHAPPDEARGRLTSDGLTLAQLEDIGREVGIGPAAIAQAVATIDQQGTATSRRLLGVTIGVGRTVELPRRLTDEEWERLVVDLRETFDARGVMRSEGSMRQWTNGNLQALLEPTATGQRLRLRTLKGSAGTAIAMGAGFIAVAAVGFVVEILQGGSFEARDLARAAPIAAIGVGAIAVWMARLPAWVRTRREQMEAIGARLVAYLRSSPGSDPDSPAGT